MSPEEQRISIAKACGWKSHTTDGHTFHDGPITSWTTKEGVFDQLPDYLNDLNAMHEAENDVLDTDSMSPTGEIAYFNQLDSVCGCRAYSIRATAAQRAEAFLKTLNLWTPTP